jgi:hypothetical protein
MMQRGFFRSADWLDAARVGGYLRLVALVQAAALVWLLATASGGVDRNGFLIGSDFLSFWTSGRMLVAGALPYDAAAHIAEQRAFFAQDGYVAFFYPPPFLLACFPLGLLPYFPALAAWLGVTGAAYLAAVRVWQREFLPARPVWLLAAAFPPVWLTITHGQTSFLAAALVGAGALLVGRRPWLAGCLIGLAIFKPQYGLLIPVVLLASGQWRTILGAGASAVMLAAASAIAFGPQVWLDWYVVTAEAGNTVTNNAVGYGKMVSVTAAAMLLGAPAAVASVLQLLVSLTVAGALAVAGWRRGYTPALAAAMLAGTPLVTPFVLDYDLTLIAFPLIWLASREPRAWERIVTLLAFAAPAFARPLAVNLGLPVMVPVLALLFVLLLRRALAGDEALA